MSDRRLDAVNRTPLLHWMIFTGVSLFALALLWHYGLIRQMLVADRTYISSVIVLLYIGTSLHCLWRLVALAREGDAARSAARLVGLGRQRITLVEDRVAIAGAGSLPKGLIASYLRDIVLQAERLGAQRLDPTPLLRALAVRLRGPNQFGAFASDTLMKLGLVGTIVGFIMMLSPIAHLDAADRGALKSSMSVMSDGMAVAMYTTLVGLVGSILVRIQYYMLEGATTKLFAAAVGLVDAYVVALSVPSDPRE